MDFENHLPVLVHPWKVSEYNTQGAQGNNVGRKFSEYFILPAFPRKKQWWETVAICSVHSFYLNYFKKKLRYTEIHKCAFRDCLCKETWIQYPPISHSANKTVCCPCPCAVKDDPYNLWIINKQIAERLSVRMLWF